MSCLILLHSSEPRGLPRGQTPDVLNSVLVLVSLVRANYTLCLRNSGIRNEAVILLPDSSPTPVRHSQPKDFCVPVPHLYITLSEFCGSFLFVLYGEFTSGPSSGIDVIAPTITQRSIINCILTFLFWRQLLCMHRPSNRSQSMAAEKGRGII